MRVEEITLHGIHHWAAVTLMTTQVNSRHELRWLQPSFPSGDDQHELVEDFTGHADAVANITSAKGIMNNVFFGL